MADDYIYYINNSAESLFWDLADVLEDGSKRPVALGGAGITRVRCQVTPLGGSGSVTNYDSDAGSPIAFIDANFTGRVELRPTTSTLTKANSTYTIRWLVMRSSGRTEAYPSGAIPIQVQVID